MNRAGQKRKSGDGYDKSTRQNKRRKTGGGGGGGGGGGDEVNQIKRRYDRMIKKFDRSLWTDMIYPSIEKFDAAYGERNVIDMKDAYAELSNIFNVTYKIAFNSTYDSFYIQRYKPSTVPGEPPSLFGDALRVYFQYEDKVLTQEAGKTIAETLYSNQIPSPVSPVKKGFNLLFQCYWNPEKARAILHKAVVRIMRQKHIEAGVKIYGIPAVA